MRDRVPWRGFLLIALIAIAGASIYFSVGRRFDPAAIAIAIRDRWWAIPAYFLAYALLDLVFIPTQFLSIAAVLMWGWIRGGTIELFAATIGAVPPYLVARSTLREWIVDRLSSHRHAAEMLDREGFTLLLLLRVVPIIPYTPLNYVAGLTSLRVAQYVLATFIGIMPSTFIFAWFVQSIADGVMNPREATLRALAAGVLFAMLIIATRLAAPRLRRRMQSSSHTALPPDAGRRDSSSPALPPE